MAYSHRKQKWKYGEVSSYDTHLRIRRECASKAADLMEISELLAQKKAQEKKLKYKMFNAEESLA